MVGGRVLTHSSKSSVPWPSPCNLRSQLALRGHSEARPYHYHHHHHIACLLVIYIYLPRLPLLLLSTPSIAMHPTPYSSEFEYNNNDDLNPKHARLHHPRARPSPQHSDFSDSPLESSSSGEIDSFSKSRQPSRPSTSSGGLLNTRMQHLMTPSPSHLPVVQPVWPPMVIQLEEAPQEPLPRSNMDTHSTRMDRINSWRKEAGEIFLSFFCNPVHYSLSPTATTLSTPSQDHAQLQVKGVRARTSDVSLLHLEAVAILIINIFSFFFNSTDALTLTTKTLKNDTVVLVPVYRLRYLLCYPAGSQASCARCSDQSRLSDSGRIFPGMRTFFFSRLATGIIHWKKLNVL